MSTNVFASRPAGPSAEGAEYDTHPELALAAVLLVLTNWVKLTKKWHPIVFIGLSAAVGVVFRFGGA